MADLPVPAWFKFAERLPSSLPDAAYDAQREKFFQENVVPLWLQQGYNPEAGREEFFKKTERPGKSAVPRAALLGASALKSLVEPLAGAIGSQQGPGMRQVNKLVEGAREEAQRQDVSTLLPEFAGTALGMAPYFAPLAGMGSLATRAAASGVIQGTYDAARAQEGHRLTEGLTGVVLGAAGEGIAELGLKALMRPFKRSGAITEVQEDAVEAVIKGTASPAEEAAAAPIMEAVQADPQLSQQLQQSLLKTVNEQLAKAKRTGVPKEAIIAEAKGSLKVQVKSADGKVYAVGHKKPLQLENFPELVERLGGHLQKGGEVVSVSGDPEVVNGFYLQLERLNTKRGEYDVPMAGFMGLEGMRPNPADSVFDFSRQGVIPMLRESDVDIIAPTWEGSPVPDTELPLGELSSSAATAAEPSPALPVKELLDDLKARVADPSVPEEMKEAARTRLEALSPTALSEVSAPKELTPAQQLALMRQKSAEIAKQRGQRLEPGESKAAPPAVDLRSLSNLQKLPNGMVRDVTTGEFYRSEVDALARRGVLDRRYAADELKPGRRDFLKQAGGAGAAGLGAKAEALAKAADAGSAGATAELKNVLRLLETSVSEVAGPFKLLGRVGSAFKVQFGDLPPVLRSIEGLSQVLMLDGDSSGWAQSIIAANYRKDTSLVKALIDELLDSPIARFSNDIWGMSSLEQGALTGIMPEFPQVLDALDLYGSRHFNLEDTTYREVFRDPKKFKEMQETLQKQLRTQKLQSEIEDFKVKRLRVQRLRSGTVTPGMELQRTPEWELGPSGPGQFQRASKMRYAIEGTPMVPGDKWKYGADDLDELINQRNSLYHRTDVQAAKEILESSSINPSERWTLDSFDDLPEQDMLRAQKALAAGDFEELKAALAGTYPGSEHQFASRLMAPGGASMSRQSKIPTLGENRSITFVVDKEKVATKPLAERGFAKSNVDQSEEKTAEGVGVGLGQIRGVIVNLAELQKESENPSQVLRELTALAKEKGVPIRAVWSDAELQSYRAGLSRQPAGMRFAQEGPTRREMLKQVGGAAGSLAAKGEALTKASAAGSSAAETELSTLLKSINSTLKSQGYKLAKRFGDKFLLVHEKSPHKSILAEDFYELTGVAQLGSDYLVEGELRSLPDSFSQVARINDQDLWKAYDEAFRSQPIESALWDADSNVGKRFPELKRIQKLLQENGLENFGPTKLSLKKLEKLSPEQADQLVLKTAKAQKVAYLEEQKLLDRAAEERLNKQTEQSMEQHATQPRGLALQRTDLTLGEGGQGGVLKRFSSDPSYYPGADEPPTEAIWKARPHADRAILGGEIPGAPGASAATLGNHMEKPAILYAQFPSRQTVFHENMHAHASYLGLQPYISRVIGSEPMAKQLASAFVSHTNPTLYQETMFHTEEVLAYGFSAIRTNDERWIKVFADANDGREHVLQWFGQKAQELYDVAATKPASASRNQLMRKTADVVRRATTEVEKLQKNTASVFGKRVGYDAEKFWVEDDDLVRKIFKNRYELAEHLEQNYAEPYNAPELIDDSVIPRDIPRYAGKIPPPTAGGARTTLPAAMEGGRAKTGLSALSFFIRPFYNWVQTVSQKNQWPELYEAFRKIEVGETSHNNFSTEWQNKLGKIMEPALKANNPDRMSDYFNWFTAATSKDRDKVAEFSQFSKQEQNMLDRMQKEFFEPLGDTLGVNAEIYLRKMQTAMRNAGYNPRKLREFSSDGINTAEQFEKWLERGDIDPKENNLWRFANAYLRLGSQRTHMGQALEDATKLVNLKNAEGESVLGSLRPLFERHIAYMKGQPDLTGSILNSAVNGVMESWNEQVGKLAGKFPWLERLEFQGEAKDALGRFMLFSYAGGLGMRPMAWIRDASQIFLTTYPLLGSKYLVRGMVDAFPGRKKGSAQWLEAEQAGALMTHSDLMNLYSSTGQPLDPTKMTKLAEWMLKPLAMSNNSNRLVSYFGHKAMAKDALEGLAQHGDQKRFLRESGLTWLDAPQQQDLLNKLQTMPHEKWLMQVGKELTDASQWNYRRGANPGMYKWALGRLMGQYGTWPLNYVEFLRRLSTQSDKRARNIAITRMALMHTSVLTTGATLGLDTASWVFNNPMAFGGSPILQATLAAPQALDSQGRKGQDARNTLESFLAMSVPGGLAASNFYRAVNEDDTDELWKTILGFQPLTKEKQDRGLQSLVPDE